MAEVWVVTVYPMVANALHADGSKIYAKIIDINAHGPMVEDCHMSPPIVWERNERGLT